MNLFKKLTDNQKHNPNENAENPAYLIRKYFEHNENAQDPVDLILIRNYLDYRQELVDRINAYEQFLNQANNGIVSISVSGLPFSFQAIDQSYDAIINLITKDKLDSQVKLKVINHNLKQFVIDNNLK